MERQTVTVTGNWLDLLTLFIKSGTIYSVGELPCSDVMEYITKTLTEIRRFLFRFKESLLLSQSWPFDFHISILLL